MDPLDPMDPRIAGWWQITNWTPRNGDPEAPTFPENGLIKGSPLVIMKSGKAFNCFWPDEDQLPCSLHYPAVAESLVTFAGVSFPCEIQERTLEIVPESTPWFVLTVTLSSAAKDGGTGNTGTFIAQSVPGPPPCGEPGPDEPGT